jgi:hypothetical protein
MFRTISESVKEGTCPYCGKDAFVYTYEDKSMFLCHHCQRHLDEDKVKRYVNNNNDDSRDTGASKSVAVNYSSVLRSCSVLSDLPDNHISVQYARSRNFPSDAYSKLYYCPDFGEVSAYAGIKTVSSERLILPFYNSDNQLFGLQGRSLDGSEPRYITLMFDKEEDKMFGLDKVDITKTFICVEGPIDSLFLKNCLAMAGSDGLSDKYISNAVLCFDNEPRNKQIVDKVERYIDKGFKTVVWPDHIKEKDINDMVLKGIDVQSVVERNTYAGLAAKIKFNAWKKI